MNSEHFSPASLEQELSPEIAQALQELDEFPDLRSSEKIDILGVFIDLKSLAFIYDSFVKDVFPMPDLESLKKIVHKLGMNMIYKTNRENDDQYNGSWQAIVSKSNKNIWHYLRMDMKETSRAIKARGALLGYPPSSTKAFLNEIDRLPDHTENQLIKDNPLVNFIGFILSTDHYQQEITDYVAPLAAATQKYLPSTYTEKTKQSIISESPSTNSTDSQSLLPPAP